jgi:hypothetical protein
METGQMTNTDTVLASVLPSKGTHNTVLVDIVDLGEEDHGYGPKPYIQLVWETQETKPSGYPFVVRRTYSLSFHEKSSLTKDLESWLDRKLRDEEKWLAFVKSLKGKPAQLKIGHTQVNEKVYPTIKKVLPAGETKLKPSGSYRTKEQWDAWHRMQEGGEA